MSEAAAAIQWRVEQWFPDLSGEQLDKMRKYHDELHRGNRAGNLVSAKTLPMADVIHFADSILAARMIHKDNPGMSELFDLGSGSGFPGLVFGILFPKVRVVLIESDAKRCEFLRQAVSASGLGNVTVENVAIEAVAAGRMKVAVARGLASISKVILMTRKVMPTGSALYHMKGENWSAEVGEIPTQLCSVWSPALVGEYKLPLGPMRFAVVRTDKIS